MEKQGFLETLRRHRFLLEELVKRDFKQKYKRTVLGMGWSILSPLLTLLVMRLVFTQFFGRTMAHYTTYLFAGNLMYAYFREATTGGMSALMSNAHIFTKINVPKYFFLLTRNVSAVINFGLTLAVFLLFAWIDGVTFTWRFVLLVYPILCLTLMNIGVGLILSALYVFFRDIQYLYDVFMLLLMYCSAIFYTVDAYPEHIRRLFLLNPLYDCITYVRTVVLDGAVPAWQLHLLLAGFAGLFLFIGGLIYRKKNHTFLYYV